MGYPKYDKEEAERVYNESLGKYKQKQAKDKEKRDKRHPADKLDEEVNGFLTLFIAIFCVAAIIGSIIMFARDANKPETFSRKESVVITKYKIYGQHFVVDYYTLAGAEHGNFETREINFSLGDTITVDVHRNKEDNQIKK